MRGLLGIDVGTGSVRGCIFDEQGNELVQPYVLTIKTKITYDDQLGEHLYAQSSADIWRQTTQVIEHLVKSIDIEVIGIGFDATCSLVLLDATGVGVPLDTEDCEVFDVILWKWLIYSREPFEGSFFPLFSPGSYLGRVLIH